jgi:signal transduction histidine kinase
VPRLGLRELKWLTFGVAALGASALDALLHLADPGGGWVAVALRSVALVGAVFVFNEYAFALVARRDALLAEERERLWALHRISRGVALLPAWERNLTPSLEILRQVARADLVLWIERTEDGGALERAAVGRRGASPAAWTADDARVLWEAVAGGHLQPVDPARGGVLGSLQGEGVAAAVAVGAGADRLLGAVVVAWRRAYRPSAAEREFLANVGSLLGVAAENLRLYRETERLGALAERERIAREMHDGLAQALTYLKLKAEAALARARPGTAPVLEKALQAIRQGATEALGDVRQVLMDLKAPPGAGRDLAAALAEQVRAWSELCEVEVRVNVPEGPVLLPPATQAEVLRIVQEALANVRKHAQARHVAVDLRREDGAVVLSVADDGRGFDVGSVKKAGHFGLGILRDRAAAIGAVLHIASRPGEGTQVVVRVPAADGAAAAPAAVGQV